jgi:hypothetical protein
MAQILSENWDLVECSLRAAAKRISPEKFDPVLEAAAAIREFPARQGLMFSPLFMSRDLYLLYLKQCWGSVAFWCGSGSGFGFANPFI